MTKNLSFESLVVVAVVSFACSALAQEPAPAYPANQPAQAYPAGDPAAQPAPAQPADPAAAPPTDAPPAEGAVVGVYPRFRWGISFMAGPLTGGTSGGAGGIDTRFGAQISDLLGLYLQPALMFGAGASSSAAAGSGSALAVVGAGLLADFTFINLFYAAIGPELLYGGFASVASTAAGSGGSASAGTFFSLATRLGIALGSTTPEHKKRFTLGLDMHIVFVPGNVTVMPMIALGYDKF
jgi:hypothetical protein